MLPSWSLLCGLAAARHAVVQWDARESGAAKTAGLLSADLGTQLEEEARRSSQAVLFENGQSERRSSPDMSSPENGDWSNVTDSAEGWSNVTEETEDESPVAGRHTRGSPPASPSRRSSAGEDGLGKPTPQTLRGLDQLLGALVPGSSPGRLVATLMKCPPGRVPVQLGFGDVNCVLFQEVVAGANLVKDFIWPKLAGAQLADEESTPARGSALHHPRALGGAANIFKGIQTLGALAIKAQFAKKLEGGERGEWRSAGPVVVEVASHGDRMEDHLDVLIRAADALPEDRDELARVIEASKYMTGISAGAPAVFELLREFNVAMTEAAADYAVEHDGARCSAADIYGAYCREHLGGPVGVASTPAECLATTARVHAFNMFCWTTLDEFNVLTKKQAMWEAELSGAAQSSADGPDPGQTHQTLSGLAKVNPGEFLRELGEKFSPAAWSDDLFKVSPFAPKTGSDADSPSAEGWTDVDAFGAWKDVGEESTSTMPRSPRPTEEGEKARKVSSPFSPFNWGSPQVSGKETKPEEAPRKGTFFDFPWRTKGSTEFAEGTEKKPENGKETKPKEGTEKKPDWGKEMFAMLAKETPVRLPL